jgi:hypothetical protein
MELKHLILFELSLNEIFFNSIKFIQKFASKFQNRPLVSTTNSSICGHPLDTKGSQGEKLSDGRNLSKLVPTGRRTPQGHPSTAGTAVGVQSHAKSFSSPFIEVTRYTAALT